MNNLDDELTITMALRKRMQTEDDDLADPYYQRAYDDLRAKVQELKGNAKVTVLKKVGEANDVTLDGHK